jgi:hypothetical protein
MRRDKDYGISRQMQEDLIKAYCKACDGSWTMEDACAKAVKMPAPRFYVSPKTAYLIISPMVKGNFEKVDLCNPSRRRMYYELYKVVLKLAEKREFVGESLWHIINFAVTQPAPEFFVSPHSLYCIRLNLKKGRIEEDGRQGRREVKGIRKRKK